MQFSTIFSCNDLVIAHNNKITNTSNLKSLGIMIDVTLSWKGHVDKIATRLSQACYIISQTIFIARCI